MPDNLDDGCHVKSEQIMNDGMRFKDLDCPPQAAPLITRLGHEALQKLERGLSGSSAPTQEEAHYKEQAAQELAAEDKVLAATQKFIYKNWTDPETRITAFNQASILFGFRSSDPEPMKLDSQHALSPNDMQKLTQFVDQVKHDNPGFKPPRQ